MLGFCKYPRAGPMVLKRWWADSLQAYRKGGVGVPIAQKDTGSVTIVGKTRRRRPLYFLTGLRVQRCNQQYRNVETAYYADYL